MKKNSFIVIIIAVVLIFSSCGVSNSPETSESSLPTTSNEVAKPSEPINIITINIPTGVNIKFIKSIETHTVKMGLREVYSDIDSWYDFIKDSFGIDIKINYLSSLYYQDICTGKYYIDKITANDLTGLILIEYGNYNSLVAMKDAEVILPLDEYLNSSEVYKNMPDEMKNSFRMADNKIWALPAEYNSTLYGRYYRKEWLNNLELDIPNSLEELYEVTKAFAYNDPDKNGENNETGMNGMYHKGPGMFGDVFLANNCYLSNLFSTSIAFDYSTGAYEDAILKTEMKDSLDYIKRMIDEGIVEFSSKYTFLDSNNTGNFFGDSNFDMDSSIWELSYTLTPNKQNSIVGVKPERFYAIASNTENPEKCISDFLATFYTSKEGMLSGIYGIEGENYSLNDTVVTIKESPFIELVGNFPYLKDNNISKYIQSSGDEQVINPKNYEIYSSLAAQNMLIPDLEMFPHKTNKNIQGMFLGSFTYNFLGIYDEMSTSDFIENYINTMKKVGAQQVLDELNEEAGTIATKGY